MCIVSLIRDGNFKADLCPAKDTVKRWLGWAEAVFPTAWETMEKWKEWEVVSNKMKKPEMTEVEFLKGLAERRVQRTHKEVWSEEGKDGQAPVVESYCSLLPD